MRTGPSYDRPLPFFGILAVTSARDNDHLGVDTINGGILARFETFGTRSGAFYLKRQ
jgi:hypothetical protein